jgi:hypothetical protein
MVSSSVRFLTLAFAGLAIAVGTQSLRADIIPTLADNQPVAEGEAFRWSYEAYVARAQRVETGDWFTIYDFVGFIPGSNQQPEGWEFSAQPLGITPDRVLPEDSAAHFNLTWRYVGQATLGDGETSAVLGDFSALSEHGGRRIGWFTGLGTNATGGIEDGTKVENVGNIAVPIPLPGAVLMFPLGAAVAGLMYRRMRREMK